jgi:hypothetical protein
VIIKPKHEKASNLIRNNHKISHLMDLSGTQTLEVPKTLNRPLENPRLKPYGVICTFCTLLDLIAKTKVLGYLKSYGSHI